MFGVMEDLYRLAGVVVNAGRCQRMKRLTVVDLFSGLGGFSQSFVDRGHNVMRIDNEPALAHVPETVIADVLVLTFGDLPEEPDIILASPPCTHFSCAAGWRYWPGGVAVPEVQESVTLVRHTLDLINTANPKYWVLENPRGMLRKVIGPPVVTTWWGAWGMPYLKPTDLWGKLPALDWPPHPRLDPMRESTHGKHKGVQENKTDLIDNLEIRGLLDYAEAPALRALIPYKFSEALCISMEQERGGQSDLLEWTL